MFLFKTDFLPDAFKEMFLLKSHIHRYNTRHYNILFSYFPVRNEYQTVCNKFSLIQKFGMLGVFLCLNLN